MWFDVECLHFGRMYIRALYVTLPKILGILLLISVC